MCMVLGMVGDTRLSVWVVKLLSWSSSPRTNDGVVLRLLQDRSEPLLTSFLRTATTQVFCPFSQVTMKVKALQGIPRGPGEAGVGDPERAPGRC